MSFSRRGAVLGLAGALAVGLGLAAREVRSWLPRPAPYSQALSVTMSSEPEGYAESGEWIAAFESFDFKVSVRACNTRTGEKFLKTVGATSSLGTYPLGLAISADGKLLACSLPDDTNHFVGLLFKRNSNAKPFVLKQDCFSWSRFSSDSRTLYICDWNIASVIETKTGRTLRQWKLPKLVPPRPEEEEMDDSLLTPRGELCRVMPLSSKRAILSRFNFQTGHETRAVFQTQGVGSFVFSPSGKFMSGGKAGLGPNGVTISDGQTGKLLWSQKLKSTDRYPQPRVLFSPDETMCVVVSGNQFELYETKTGKFLRWLPILPGTLFGWRFSSDGSQLFVQTTGSNGENSQVTAQRAR